MADFGFSVGDFLAAIQFVIHIAKAFDTAEGAKKDYKESKAFLQALLPVLQKLASSVQDEDDSLNNDIQGAAKILIDSHATFAKKLCKRRGLEYNCSQSFKAVIHTLQWSLDVLNDKIKELKEGVLGALAIVENLIVADIRSKVDGLVKAVKYQDGQLDETTKALSEIRMHIASLEQVSLSYTTKLNDAKEQGDEAANHRDAQVKEISEKLGALAISQDTLGRSLEKLIQHIQTQQEQASPTEMEVWVELEEKAEKESKDLGEISKKTSENLGDIRDLVGGFGAVTKQKQLGVVAGQVDGASRFMTVGIKTFGRVSQRFRRKSESKDMRGVAHNPSPECQIEGRVPKPVPSIAGFKPPPRRTSLPPGGAFFKAESPTGAPGTGPALPLRSATTSTRNADNETVLNPFPRLVQPSLPEKRPVLPPRPNTMTPLPATLPPPGPKPTKSEIVRKLHQMRTAAPLQVTEPRLESNNVMTPTGKDSMPTSSFNLANSPEEDFQDSHELQQDSLPKRTTIPKSPKPRRQVSQKKHNTDVHETVPRSVATATTANASITVYHSKPCTTTTDVKQFSGLGEDEKIGNSFNERKKLFERR